MIVDVVNIYFSMENGYFKLSNIRLPGAVRSKQTKERFLMTAAPTVWEAQAEHRFDLRHDDVHRSWVPLGSFDPATDEDVTSLGERKRGEPCFGHILKNITS